MRFLNRIKHITVGLKTLWQYNQFFFSFLRIPEDWTHVGRVDPKEELQLTFALKQQNVDLLEKTLQLVSDPDSAHYGGAHSYWGCFGVTQSSDQGFFTGKYLTLEEVGNLVRPSDLTQKEVRHWLQTNGVTNCQTVHTQDFLECSMTAG